MLSHHHRAVNPSIRSKVIRQQQTLDHSWASFTDLQVLREKVFVELAGSKPVKSVDEHGQLPVLSSVLLSAGKEGGLGGGGWGGGGWEYTHGSNIFWISYIRHATNHDYLLLTGLVI